MPRRAQPEAEMPATEPSSAGVAPDLPVVATAPLVESPPPFVGSDEALPGGTGGEEPPAGPEAQPGPVLSLLDPAPEPTRRRRKRGEPDAPPPPPPPLSDQEHADYVKTFGFLFGLVFSFVASRAGEHFKPTADEQREFGEQTVAAFEPWLPRAGQLVAVAHWCAWNGNYIWPRAVRTMQERQAKAMAAPMPTPADPGAP